MWGKLCFSSVVVFATTVKNKNVFVIKEGTDLFSALALRTETIKGIHAMGAVCYSHTQWFGAKENVPSIVQNSTIDC